MFGLGFAELVLVLAIVLFVFGWGRLPQLGGNFMRITPTLSWVLSSAPMTSQPRAMPGICAPVVHHTLATPSAYR